MPKIVSQIIERERPDGWKEAIVIVTDTETGEQNSGTTEWYYDGDRKVRVDYLIENLLK